MIKYFTKKETKPVTNYVEMASLLSNQENTNESAKETLSIMRLKPPNNAPCWHGGGKSRNSRTSLVGIPLPKSLWKTIRQFLKSCTNPMTRSWGAALQVASVHMLLDLSSWKITAATVCASVVDRGGGEPGNHANVYWHIENACINHDILTYWWCTQKMKY